MKKTKLSIALCFAGSLGYAQIINTVAGNGTAGFSGDGGQASAAELYNPGGVAFDASGNMYIADYNNNRIRKVSTSGVITTIAGTGTAGSTGDGGQASAAELYTPIALNFDASGNLFIADKNNSCIRKINTSGVISTFAGNGTNGFSGDGGQASAAELAQPTGIVIDATGNLYIADYNNNRIRKVNSSGIIGTFAGNGTAGFSGDGGQASSAKLDQPSALTFDASGNLYIADLLNNRIRKITIPLCTANAGSNVTDYSNADVICDSVQLGTSSIAGLTYAWSPTTALNCTNCAQPYCSYDNATTPQVYTVTVSGTGCTTNTSTVQVKTVVPTLTAHITGTSAIIGHNVTATGSWSGNTTPNNYYWEIIQCDQYGNTLTGPGTYSWSGWTSGAPSGTFTFSSTSTFSCNTYYKIGFAVQNTNVCFGWAPASGVMVEVALDPNYTASFTKINSTTYTASAVYPTDNPTGSAGYGYSWDVVETSGGTPVSGTEVSSTTNTACWLTAPSNFTFKGYNTTSTLSGCTSAGQFIAGDYYKVTYSVWSTVCAMVQSAQTFALCGIGCRTKENPEGVIITKEITSPIIVQNTTDIKSLHDLSSSVNVYPNPNTGNFTIEANTSLMQLMQVFDVTGKLVLSQTLQGASNIDASLLPAGIYNISITGNNNIVNKRLVIVK